MNWSDSLVNGVLYEPISEIEGGNNGTGNNDGGEEEEEEDEEVQQCQVCGDTSDSHHFGANVCRACAAFFRRTIAGRLRYACRYEDKCDFSKSSRAMCKSCRLAKCIRVGMDANAVRSRQLMDRRHDNNNNRNRRDASSAAAGVSTNSTPTPPALSMPCPIPLNATATTTTPFCGYAPPPQQQQLNNATAFFALNNNNNGNNISNTNNVLQQLEVPIAHQQHNLPSLSPLMMPAANVIGTGADGVKLMLISEAQLDAFGVPQYNPPEEGTKRRLLEEILQNGKTPLLVDQSDLPQGYPTLAKIVLGHKQVEARRDERYGRLRMVDGQRVRMFVEKQMLDLHAYWQALHNEIDWVAEMLFYFGMYERLSVSDKMVLFKNFWILFIILERNYDAFDVLRATAAGEDSRMVFGNGDVYDMSRCQYDLSRIGHKPAYDVNNCPLKPWFKRSVREVLPLVRRLEPRPIELAYCFGIMFWRVSDEIFQKISPEAKQCANEMVEQMYRELATFYMMEMPEENAIRRVAELGRLISITELLALQRKEETILARTFQAFKVDIYMEEIFGRS